MGILQKIYNMIWRASLRFRRVQPARILLSAQTHFLLLRLFFVDRQRQLENVGCDIMYISPKKVIIRSNKHFLPDVLRSERCSLYVKIPHGIAEKDVGIDSPALKHGFIFKSRIISNFIDPESKYCIIEIAMPQKYVQRDLQRHERVSLTPLMLKNLSLWICDKHVPSSLHDIETELFTCVDGNVCSSVKLLNISAGGIRVQLENIRGFDNPRRELNKNFVVHLALYKPMRKELSVWSICSCVKVHFSSRLNILTLFLKFVQVWDDPKEGGVGWYTLGREGIAAIEAWVDNDYCMLLDKNRMISEELCRCFGLDPASAFKKSPARL